MFERILPRAVVLTLVFASACAHEKDEQASAKVLQQASFDLKCDAGQLKIQKISDDHQMMGVKNTTWGVRGCDRQATYKSSCGLGNCQIINEAQMSASR